jgi:hypothetical protein
MSGVLKGARLALLGGSAKRSRWITASYATRAVVALRFDDGKAIDYTTTFGALTSRGLVGGFAIPSSAIGGANMTAAQLREMQAAGMEIQSHSKTHGADPATLADFLVEINDSYTTLTGLGLDIASFITPGTWVTPLTYLCNSNDWYGTDQDLALRARYKSFEAYNNSLYDNSFRFNLPVLAAKRYGWSHPTYSDATYTLAQMKAHVDAAIAEGRCYEALCHAWDLDGVGKTTWANYLAWLDYLELRQSQGLVTVLTPCQMVYASGPSADRWLFFIDHETGTTEQWTSNSDAVHITASASAGLKSSATGLAVNVTSTTAFYVAKTGNNSTTGKLRVRFYIDPNTLTMATNDTFAVMRLFDTGYNVVIGCYLKWTGTTYQLLLEYGTDGGTLFGTGRAITDAPHYVELYVTRASSNVASDGTATMWIDGTQYDAFTGLDNYDRFPQYANMRAGGVTGLDAGTSGTFYLDEVVVNETGTQIGA